MHCALAYIEVGNASVFICRGGLAFNCNVEKKYTHTWNFFNIENMAPAFDTVFKMIHTYFLAGKQAFIKYLS